MRSLKTNQEFTFSLTIYSGDVFRRRDAVVIKVEEGEQARGADITLPLSRLHSISGTLTAKDGHAINSGTVELLFSGTQEEVTRVQVENDDGTFQLPYVPEGSYILSVRYAHDVVWALTFNGTFPPTRNVARIVRAYGDLSEPLALTTDIQSLNLIVPDQSTTTASK